MGTKTVVIKGITYQSTPEFSIGSCENCAACTDTSLCHEIVISAGCDWSEGIIFQMIQEPRYTVDEVLTVLEDNGYCPYPTDSEVNTIKNFLLKKSYPEYKQYLALKAKFGE